jgi:hypothetical protein
MPKSYRLRTQLGVDQTIRLNVEQDFDFLEILSMKLTQGDAYTRFCADYGVVVGRVVANGGYGVPNARISVFVPVEDVDLLNPIISSLYPYKSPAEKNEDGYRYNLLPYDQEYGGHTPTGTFPNREDLLTRQEVLEIYEKYYKYTVKTNESGDFMIVGVPLGIQTLTMDLDLSNMGEFSLRPQDLVRMGLATSEEVNGTQFLASTDLDSLPQIINAKKDIDVSSFWGDGSQCSIGITRADFDLRELGVDIQPTAIFMGSIMSSQDTQMLKKNCKPKTEQGDLCGMITGPGEILAIRQTVNTDVDGNPILEQYRLQNSGKVIDDDGTFLVDVPMNLDYVVTNEYGEIVFSKDPRIGIPTNGKYRFKIKYQSETNGPTREGTTLFPIQGEIQRGNFLVPNIREYGWTGTTTANPGVDPALYALDTSPHYDPNFTGNTNWQLFQKSYAFSLNWDDYANKQAAINCEDFFYQMKFNKVYTTSQFIEEYRKGRGRARFLGVKEILDRTCESENNKFPVNDGVRNFDAIYFVFNILFTILQVPLILIAFIYSAFVGLYPFIKNVLPAVFIGIAGYQIAANTAGLIAAISTAAWGAIILSSLFLIAWGLVGYFVTKNFKQLQNLQLYAIPLPNYAYPECNACDCGPKKVNNVLGPVEVSNSSILANTNQYTMYNGVSVLDNDGAVDQDWVNKFGYGFQTTMAGNPFTGKTDGTYNQNMDRGLRTPYLKGSAQNPFTNYNNWSWDIPLSERMNLFNVKAKFHDNGGYNQMKVTFGYTNPSNSSQFHYDNVLVLLVDPGTMENLPTGQLLSFQNPNASKDPNITGQTIENGFGNFSSTGTSAVGNISIVVNSMNPSNVSVNQTATYVITGSTNNVKEYLYPSDVEYFQIITGHTVEQFQQICSPAVLPQTSYGSPNNTLLQRFLFGYQRIKKGGGNNPDIYPDDSGWSTTGPNIQLIQDYRNHEIIFLARGVDPNSDKQDIEYDMSKLYGYNSFGNKKVRGSYLLNIPIQKYQSNTDWRIPRHNQFVNNGSTNLNQNIFYPSYNFSVTNYLASWTTKNHLYYSALDQVNSAWDINQANSGQGFVNSGYNQAIAAGGGSWNRMINNGNVKDGFRNGYLSNEVVEGGTYMAADGSSQIGYDFTNYSPIYINGSAGSMSMSNSNRLVMRTDRLPSSDALDGRLVLHQNSNFSLYSINSPSEIQGVTGSYNTGTDNFSDPADDYLEDVGGNLSVKIQQTFSCEGMVPLKCYSGDGENIGVKNLNDDCYYYNREDNIRNMYDGCYYLVQEPFKFQKDLLLFSEWKARFRFNFALCRNVISLTFVNNWINGSLYMYSFQKDTLYLAPLSASTFNSDVTYRYCTDTLVYKETNNSFFYRSSPYNGNIFIGKQSPRKIDNTPYPDSAALNKRLLGSPTTMIDLGPRDQFVQEISLNPDYEGFIIDKIPSTSYNDTSDLLQLFVISRLTDSNFLSQLTQSGDASITQLFSRTNSRLDGDVTQLLSINSEFGVSPYLGDNYGQSQIKYYSTGQGPVLGVFFSANTENRDLITPGRTTFEDNTIIYLTNYYGFEDQEVPYWPWQIQNNGNLIFGSQTNDWEVKKAVPSQIYTYKYQSIDRLLGGNIASGQPTFPSEIDVPTFEKPGFIYNSQSTGGVSPTITPKSTTTPPPPIIGVGSPYHFYFGLRNGKSAMNKYINKYIFNEEVL